MGRTELDAALMDRQSGEEFGCDEEEIGGLCRPTISPE
jgi:hypothetical protein